MPKSTAKAKALSRDLADKLSKRFAGSSTIDTVREDMDSDGWPMIFCSDGGDESAGQPVIGIRISNVDAGSKDVFGNDTSAYAPHVLELAYEKNQYSAGHGIPRNSDVAIASFEAIKTGVRLQLKEIAHNSAVTAANMDATAPSADLDDLYWPTKLV